MERRDFLKVAGGGVGAALSGASCATLGGGYLEKLGVDSMDEYVARMERASQYIGEEASLDLDLPGVKMDPDQVANTGDLVRKVMRTMVLTGMFADLPREAQEDEAVQDVMWRHLPEMDETMVEVNTMIANLTPAQRDQVRSTLNNHPELGAQLAVEIDRHAAHLEVSDERRVQASEMIRDHAWKMRVQSPAILLDAYQDKMRKVEARHGGSAELQRLIAAKMGEDAFWAHAEKIESLRNSAPERLSGLNADNDSLIRHHGGSHENEGEDEDDGQKSAPSDEGKTRWEAAQDRDRKKRTKQRVRSNSMAEGLFTASAWTLGLSVAVGLLGVVLVSVGTFAGVFLVTVGSIGAFVGLLLLLAAGIAS